MDFGALVRLVLDVPCTSDHNIDCVGKPETLGLVAQPPGWQRFPTVVCISSGFGVDGRV